VKRLGAVLALAAMVGMGSLTPARASDLPMGSLSAAPAAQRAHHFTMKDPWARTVTRYGDADTSAYSIDHVFELQYRLKWEGVFHGGVTGLFGKVTRAAVKRYQQREHLKVTGIATHATWADLIHDTIRHRGAIPHICKTDGWHACYDRSMHQVTLWHNGRIHNSWLVRGGDYQYQTRVGNTSVYYRDIDHVSRVYGTAMPYSQFFDGGQAYHGSPFMIDPFVDHSHGCINMYIQDARQLWHLTNHHKLHVSVYGAWD
jgi:hypothetical protein